MSSEPVGAEAEQQLRNDTESPRRASSRCFAVLVAVAPAFSLVGCEVSFDASRYFRDPGRDGVTYTATTEPPRNVEISISGDEVVLEGKSLAGALVTLLATDSRGLATRTEFEVHVTRSVPGG